LELAQEQIVDAESMDNELEQDVLHALDQIKPEENIVMFENWEEFVMEKSLRKRKTPSQ
jgi:hypothetical protein